MVLFGVEDSEGSRKINYYRERLSNESLLLVTLNAKFIHSSLCFLAYLKAFAENDSIDIEIKEYSINEQTMDILADIYKAKADVVCFSCYIWNIKPT